MIIQFKERFCYSLEGHCFGGKYYFLLYLSNVIQIYISSMLALYEGWCERFPLLASFVERI